MLVRECGICCEELTNCFVCPACEFAVCADCLLENIIHTGNIVDTCPNCQVVIPADILFSVLESNGGFEIYIDKVVVRKYEQLMQLAPLILPLIRKLKVRRILQSRMYGKTLSQLSDLVRLRITIDALIPGGGTLYAIKELANTEVADMPINEVIKKRKPQLARYPETRTVRDVLPDIISSVNIFQRTTGLSILALWDMEASTLHNDYSKREITEEIYDRLGVNQQPGEKRKAYNVEYIFRCPVDGCEGFINTQYECELCGKTFCRKCFAPMDDIHVCKEADIANFNEVKRSTKPCPKCAARIQHASGCNQMFCTLCHTGFDWTTGAIIRTNFHNPHRFEWLKSLTTDQQTRIKELHDASVAGCKYHSEHFEPLIYLFPHMSDFARTINHWRDMVRMWEGQPELYVTTVGANLLIDRMLGDVDVTTAKRIVHDRVCASKKKEILRNIMNDFIAVASSYYDDGYDKIYDLTSDMISGKIFEYNREDFSFIKSIIQIVIGHVEGTLNSKYAVEIGWVKLCAPIWRNMTEGIMNIINVTNARLKPLNEKYNMNYTASLL